MKRMPIANNDRGIVASKDARGERCTDAKERSGVELQSSEVRGSDEEYTRTRTGYEGRKS